MSNLVEWIAAQAEGSDPADIIPIAIAAVPVPSISELGSPESLLERLPAHNFPVRIANCEEREAERARERNPDLWMYRGRTVALLRRYMRLSLETGRLPSVIGREFFRAKITAYKATTFEDRVIFVHDVEKCLDRLAPFDQQIIARLILQEHDHEGTARLLNSARRTIERRLPDLLDELSEEFLRLLMLVPMAEVERELAE
jgi:hypothetical protein